MFVTAGHCCIPSTAAHVLLLTWASGTSEHQLEKGTQQKAGLDRRVLCEDWSVCRANGTLSSQHGHPDPQETLSERWPHTVPSKQRGIPKPHRAALHSEGHSCSHMWPGSASGTGRSGATKQGVTRRLPHRHLGDTDTREWTHMAARSGWGCKWLPTPA